MIIEVGTDFQIASDDNNYIIYERLKTPYKYVDKRTNETKITEWKPIKYPNSLESAYKLIFELKVKKIDQVEIKAIIREMKEIRKQIEEHFKGTTLNVNQMS